MFLMFGTFILACGTTHVMAIWTVWQPLYGIEGLVKAGTAVASIATAVMLIGILPQALTLPSPGELERANEALAREVRQRRLAEERYRTLFESAPDAMLICDAAGRITLANSQTETLFGIPRGDLVGRFVEDLVPESRRGGHVAHRRAYLDDLRLRPMGAGLDLRARRSDGSEFPVEISLSPLQTETGTLVTAAIRDITDRRRVEETVREQAGRLETLSRQLLTAQETERRAIACELHDEIGQSLTALKIGLMDCRPEAAPGGRLDDCLEVVEQVLHQVRALSLDLRPSLLDDLGLPAALRWYVDRQARRAGWTARVDTDGVDGRLPPAVEIACFRVAQEAVTNVLRHGDAHEVVVTVHPVGDAIELLVRDDGRGMDVPLARRRAARGSSMGLLGMEERVAALGGRLEIASAVGRGTEVRASFPVGPPDLSS
jgi:PAS domain S-box-containing protein